jgi:hypothetical protein
VIRRGPSDGRLSATAGVATGGAGSGVATDEGEPANASAADGPDAFAAAATVFLVGRAAREE